MALDTVLSDLEGVGYTAQAFIIPACAVDAPHRRDRCAIVAYADCLVGGTRRVEPERQPWQTRIADGGHDVAYAGCYRLEEQNLQRQKQRPTWRSDSTSGDWWETEPDVGRVVDGIPNRVDRLKCLGNAVVPAQFYPIFRAIAEVERNKGQQ